jgi:hypothetical protein
MRTRRQMNNITAEKGKKAATIEESDGLVLFLPRFVLLHEVPRRGLRVLEHGLNVQRADGVQLDVQLCACD